MASMRKLQRRRLRWDRYMAKVRPLRLPDPIRFGIAFPPGYNALGICDRCQKRIFADRRHAREAAKMTFGGEHRPRPYRCPHVDGHWHVGHLPDAVRHGEIDRNRLRQSNTRRSR